MKGDNQQVGCNTAIVNEWEKEEDDQVIEGILQESVF